jgi:hypothetical protein
MSVTTHSSTGRGAAQVRRKASAKRIAQAWFAEWHAGAIGFLVRRSLRERRLITRERDEADVYAHVPQQQGVLPKQM